MNLYYLKKYGIFRIGLYYKILHICNFSYMIQKYLLLLIFILLINFTYSQSCKYWGKKAVESKDSADYYFKKAFKEIKSENDKGHYLAFKQMYYFQINNFDSSGYFGIRALKIFTKQNNQFELAKLKIRIGKLYTRSGEYNKATKMLFESLNYFEKLKNDTLIFKVYNQLSFCYHDFEQYEKGVYYGKKSLETLKKFKSKDPSFYGKSINSIAINFDDWNKPDSAIYYHKKVFDYVKGKDTLLVNYTYNNLGNTLLKLKKYNEAKKWIVSSINITNLTENQNSKADFYYNTATNYLNLATIEYNLNQFINADKSFKVAFKAVQLSQSIEKLRDYYQQKYLYSIKKNDFKEAVNFQSKYLELRDSIFKNDRIKAFTEIDIKYQTEKKEKLLLQKEAETKQKNTTILVVSLLGLLIGLILLFIIRSQKQKATQKTKEFQLQQAISKIENQNKLQEQRLEISRDLHDNIGAQLTFITSSVDNIKQGFNVNDEKLNLKLSNISDFTKETIVELRDTIWAMNHSEISIEDLQMRIINFIDKAKEAQNKTDFDLNIDNNLFQYKLSSVEGMNIFRTIQEAINNSLKYAKANKIILKINKIEDEIAVEISDNGIGFEKESIENGNGMINMKKRILEINGTINIISEINVGTKIFIVLPINKI